MHEVMIVGCRWVHIGMGCAVWLSLTPYGCAPAPECPDIPKSSIPAWMLTAPALYKLSRDLYLFSLKGTGHPVAKLLVVCILKSIVLLRQE